MWHYSMQYCRVTWLIVTEHVDHGSGTLHDIGRQNNLIPRFLAQLLVVGPLDFSPVAALAL